DNYGGVQAISDQTYDDPQVDMSNWNIAENLLEETRYLISYVSHGNFAQDQANKRTSTRDDDDDSCTLSITAAGGEIFQSSMTKYLREQISKCLLSDSAKKMRCRIQVEPTDIKAKAGAATYEV
ncbi:hypothetical protein Tco_0091686, partial [Tanacetum coccineum]